MKKLVKGWSLAHKQGPKNANHPLIFISISGVREVFVRGSHPPHANSISRSLSTDRES
jgi:hypothetical protein